MVIPNNELSQGKLSFPNWLTPSCVSGWLFCRENFFAAASSVKAKLGQWQQLIKSTVKNFSIHTTASL
jgi:hypothetical protein